MSDTETQYDVQAYNIARDQVSNVKYLYWTQVVGLLGMVCGHHNMPLNQETIEGVKLAIIDELSDGVEIEWEEYGMWQWWDNLSADWFEMVPTKSLFGGAPGPATIRCNKQPTDFKEETRC